MMPAARCTARSRLLQFHLDHPPASRLPGPRGWLVDYIAERSPYGHAIWADACDRVFSARCIVQFMLTIASRLDVMNRLGRALADPTRSRIILTLLDHPAYPAELARDLDLTRPNVSNHLACLRDCGIVVSEPEGRRTRYEIADSHLAQALTALVDATLAVDEDAPCIDPACSLPGCDAAGEGA